MEDDNTQRTATIWFWILITVPLIIFTFFFLQNFNGNHNNIVKYFLQLNFVLDIAIYGFPVFTFIYLSILSYCYKKAGYVRKKPKPEIEDIYTYNEIGHKNAAEAKKALWCWVIGWFILYNILWFCNIIPHDPFFFPIISFPWFTMLLACILLLPIPTTIFLIGFVSFLKKSKFTPKTDAPPEKPDRKPLHESEYRRQAKTAQFFFWFWFLSPLIWVSVPYFGFSFHIVELFMNYKKAVVFLLHIYYLCIRFLPIIAIIYFALLIILFVNCKFKFVENFFREAD